MLRYVLIAIAVIGSLVCVLLGITAWRKRPAPGAGYVAGALFSAAIYAFGYGLELSSNNLEAILTCLSVEYLGIVWLPGFWLAMTLRYTNCLEWLRPARFTWLWIIPILVLAAFFSNPLHHLYYVNILLDTSGPFPVIQFDHGPIYLLQIGYILFSLIVSSFLLFRYLWLPHSLYRKQTSLILISNIVILMITTLYFAGLQPIPNLDIVVYAVILSSIIVGVGLVRYRLIDLLPVAREMLFDRINDGVLVLDGNDRLLDFNPQASRLLGLHEDSIGRPLPEMIPADLLPVLRDLRSKPGLHQFSIERPELRFFEINRTPISGLIGEKEGLLVAIHEITPLIQLQLALEEMNAELDERVKLRTHEYLQTIAQLEKEIKIRQETEKKLQAMQTSLIEQVSTQSRKLYSLYDVLIIKESAGANVLSQTLERIMQLMNADAACIHEAHEDAIYRSGSAGLPEEIAGALEVLPADWLIEGKPLVSSNLPHEERLPEALRLAGYTTFLAAPIKIHDAVTGVIEVFWREQHEILVEDISYFSIAAEQIGIILENARLRRKLEEKAVQVERRRLARDLHDSVTQSLHSLTLNVEILHSRIERGQMQKVGDMLTSIDRSARQALKEMRLLLFELRLAPLEDVRLIEVLQNRLEAVEMCARIDACLHVTEPAHWPLKWEAEMYCIAMEALNNSLKHAYASRVDVYLRGGGTWVEMKIQDNGRGFSPELIKQNGIGLQSMRERAERLGGRLLIDSKEDQGTCICLQVGEPAIMVKGGLINT